MKIARNANDILSKHLTNACPRGVLDVIGIIDTAIVRALPTELNQVIIRNRNTDIVLEQDNGSLLHLEFQLSKEPTLYRFAAYDFALAEHFVQKLRTVVLYTGDIQEGPTSLDIGTAIYQVENVYLNRLNGDEALAVVENHLANDTWTPQDRVRLAFAFHMHFEQHTQEEAFDEVLTLTRQIPDPEEQDYVTALILGLSGRKLKKKQEHQLKEMLKMTNVVREIEYEALQKGREKGRKEVREEGRKEEKQEVAERMFRKGSSVSDVVDITGLSEKDAEDIRRKLH
jgi:predicted transposase/invertase (TIGR01784 family)